MTHGLIYATKGMAHYENLFVTINFITRQLVSSAPRQLSDFRKSNKILSNVIFREWSMWLKINIKTESLDSSLYYWTWDRIAKVTIAKRSWQ